VGFLSGTNYITIGRETMDIDFSVTKLNATAPHVELVIRDIIATEIDDGVTFDWDRTQLLTQPHMEYPGFRIFLHAKFGKLKDKIQIDLGIGDAVAAQKRVFFPFEFDILTSLKKGDS